MMQLFQNNPHNISMREFRIRLTTGLKNAAWPYLEIKNSPKVELYLLDGSFMETNLVCFEKTVLDLMAAYLKEKYDRYLTLMSFYTICNELSMEFYLKGSGGGGVEAKGSGCKVGWDRSRDELLNDTPGFYASRNSCGVFSLNSSSYTKMPPALEVGENMGLFKHKLSVGDRHDRKYAMIRRKGE